MPLLSILIPTTTKRHTSLVPLLSHLYGQMEPFGGAVELLVQATALASTGGETLGSKRNTLVRAATGTYVVHVDDDDWLDSTYVAALVRACGEGKDACSISGCYLLDGMFQRTFTHALRYTDWLESPDGALLRPLNHLNPIRREIALAVPFHDVAYGEDVPWSRSLMESGLVQTEAEAPGLLYEYRFNSQKPMTGC